MGDWQGLFVGRDAELALLQSCWDLARSGEPQLAVLLAPPGLGKTRLVQEFFHRVSAEHDGAGELGYWPDRLGRDRDRFALACMPGDCNAARPMTMLWWAIKCVDSGNNGAASSDLLLAYHQHLKPHLDVRSTDKQLALLRKEQLKEGAKGLGDIGIALAEKGAEAIPVIGPFIGLTKAIGTTVISRSVRLRELHERREKLEADRLDLEGKAAAAQADFEDQLMAALGDFAAPSAEDIPPCPMIIVVDDAQFADQDPALRSFLRRFIDTAWAERWPVLVIMTHWTYEWNLRRQDVHTLPGLIEATVARQLMTAQLVTLNRLDGLKAVFEAAIPRVPEAQANAILAKAGGNARYLDRLIQLLLGSPAMFVDRKPAGALHDDALAEILREGFDLHEVTRRLFDMAPDEARRAAALASAQGERFLHELIEDTAAELGLDPLREGLDYCAHPMAIVGSMTAGVGEFSQGVFREVAQSLISRAVDREAVVRRTLLELCISRLERWEEVSAQDDRNPVPDLILLDLTIALATEATDLDAKAIETRALLRKAEILRRMGDAFGAQAAVDPIDWNDALDGFVADKISLDELLNLPQWRLSWDAALNQREQGDAVLSFHGARDALPYFEKSAEELRRLSADLKTADSRRELAVSEIKLGTAILRVSGVTRAREHYVRAFNLLLSVHNEVRTDASRSELDAIVALIGRLDTENRSH